MSSMRRRAQNYAFGLCPHAKGGRALQADSARAMSGRDGWSWTGETWYWGRLQLMVAAPIYLEWAWSVCSWLPSRTYLNFACQVGRRTCGSYRVTRRIHWTRVDRRLFYPPWTLARESKQESWYSWSKAKCSWTRTRLSWVFKQDLFWFQAALILFCHPHRRAWGWTFSKLTIRNTIVSRFGWITRLRL